MRTLILTEGVPAQRQELSAQEVALLARHELAVVMPSADPGQWEVAAGRKVGVARVGDLQVLVRPKIAMQRLVFLMGYARDPSFWRNDSVELAPQQDLPEALAETFRRLATRALERGLLHGYRAVDEALPVLRGRLRVGDQTRRRLGVGLPLEVAYDDFTADIPENQLLLAAAVRLLSLPSLSAGVRRQLQRLRLQLAEVTVLPRGIPLPQWQPSRLNTRYQPALRIADLILSGDSFEQRTGDLRVSGFVFDMWKIYEDFVCTALAEAMAGSNGRHSWQHRLHLDVAREVEMRPDFVWLVGEQPAIVVDAKYKAERPSGFPQADLYQLLAYCTTLALREGHLVYAQGNEEAQMHDLVGADVRIHCHTLDLRQGPRDLLLQVQHLGQALLASSGERWHDSRRHPVNPDDGQQSQVREHIEVGILAHG